MNVSRNETEAAQKTFEGFEETNCIFCKDSPQEPQYRTKDYRFGNSGEFSLYRCRSCGLGYQNPRPIEKNIGSYYPDTASFYLTSAETHSPWKRKLSDGTVAAYFGYSHLGATGLLAKLVYLPFYLTTFRFESVPTWVPNGKVLEIGCSTGTRLAKDKRRGWSVVGIEPNQNAAKFGRERFGMDIKTGSVFDHDFEDGSFDVIRMDMVLEHLHRPVETIERVRRWLKPKGELLISVPYLDGLEFRIFGQYCYALQLPIHLYFFNIKNFISLLNGFGQIRFQFHSVTNDFMGSLGIAAKAKNSAFLNWAARKRFLSYALYPLTVLASFLGLTSRVTIRARKL